MSLSADQFKELLQTLTAALRPEQSTNNHGLQPFEQFDSTKEQFKFYITRFETGWT